jgi:hypothetical protein
MYQMSNCDEKERKNHSAEPVDEDQAVWVLG